MAALILADPVRPLAMAQEPASMPPASHPSRPDAYDVGAAFANVAWVPLRVGWCGVSAGFGLVVLAATVGTTRAWVASIFDQACMDKWLLNGDDFRPAPSEP
jgi:hypothetical protein